MNPLDLTFSALGNSTRRAILDRLVDGEVKLSELAQPFKISQTAVSKHVRVLTQAGLITVEKRGRSRYCRLNTGPLAEADQWIGDYRSFWNKQFDNLAQHLTSQGD